DHEAAVQRRDQARADQRRFPAPRRSDDAEETGAPQSTEQIVDLFLAAEKQMIFVRFEGAKTREGIESAVARHRHIYACLIRLTNGSSADGVNAPPELMTSASCVRKRC